MISDECKAKLTDMNNSTQTQTSGSYKDLIVWQKSIVLVREIYELTKTFPNEEKFGLVSQMRRAAVSVPSNIAEGQARRTTPDFVRFVSNAEGPLAELDTQLILALQLGFCNEARSEKCFDLIEENKKMLNALRRKLMARSG